MKNQARGPGRKCIPQHGQSIGNPNRLITNKKVPEEAFYSPGTSLYKSLDFTVPVLVSSGSSCCCAFAAEFFSSGWYPAGQRWLSADSVAWTGRIPRSLFSYLPGLLPEPASRSEEHTSE